MSLRCASAAVMVSLWFCQVGEAQEVFQDYLVNVPRQYAPDDPWTAGALYGTQIGHSGHFYNCDSQEEKRWSPWITWQSQTPVCRQRFPIHCDIRQQVAEVKQRIRWGKGCDVPCYEVPWLPTIELVGESHATTTPRTARRVDRSFGESAATPPPLRGAEARSTEQRPGTAARRAWAVPWRLAEAHSWDPEQSLPR